jgi:hypothetical protein
MFVPLVSTAIYSKPVPAQVLEPLYAPSAQGPDDIRTISVDSDSSSDFAPSPIIAVPVLPDIPDHSIPMPPGFFFDMIEFTRVPAQIAFWYALAMGKFAPNINTTPELNPSCTALDILVQYGDRVGTNTAVGGYRIGFTLSFPFMYIVVRLIACLPPLQKTWAWVSASTTLCRPTRQYSLS